MIVHSHYIQYLQREGIECSNCNSWIYWLQLRWSLYWKGETGNTPTDLRSFASRLSLFHITDFYHYDLMPPSKISRQWVRLGKSASNWVPYLLRPALFILDYFITKQILSRPVSYITDIQHRPMHNRMRSLVMGDFMSKEDCLCTED